MSITSAGTLGTNNDKTSSNLITLTPSTNSPIGTYMIVAVAKDNSSAGADGDNSEVTNVDDVQGNTYRKGVEFGNTQGGAGAGAVVAIWFSKLKNALPPGQAIRAFLSAAVTAKNMFGWKFNGTSSSFTLGFTKSSTLANDGQDPGLVTTTSGTSIEYLFVRAIAREGNSAVYTETTGHTSNEPSGTVGGGAASNIQGRLEWIIKTSVRDYSDPTWTAADAASALLMLREVIPITTSPKMEPRGYTRNW